MASIDPKLRKALTGISGILVTPFNDLDKIAPSRLAPIVDRAIGAGVHILVTNGNTGEFYGLTTAEAETMVHAQLKWSQVVCPCSQALAPASMMPVQWRVRRGPPALRH